MNPFNFSDSLLGVLAQRLVRCLCKDCRVPNERRMPVTDEVKRLIIDSAPASGLFDLALAQGMLTLKQDGIPKVLNGLTDLPQILAVSQR